MDATSTKRLLDAISVLQSMIVFTRALEETAVSVGVKRSHMYVLPTRLHRHTGSQQPVAHVNADQHWGYAGITAPWKPCGGNSRPPR